MKNPPLWRTGPDGTIDRVRHAEHWHRQDARAVCGLCYRLCSLGDGEDGWCGFRGSRGGRMELLSHGIITSLVRAISGYGENPFLSYKPGMTSVFLNGIQCTSGCTFCMSTQIVHRPAAIEWAGGSEQMWPGDSRWYFQKGLLHPRDAVEGAVLHGASSVLFGINEPTLSFEWTADVAQLARRRGLDVLIETNGFTETSPIRQIAGHVGAVDVGTKGSLDPEFYEHHMRSPGAPDAVRRAMVTWQRAGVFVLVGDLVAPPHMQDGKTFTEAAKRMYGWIGENLGPLTPVLVTPIFPPGPMKSEPSARMLVRDDAEQEAYTGRLHEALQLAWDAGLPYAHMKSEKARIDCHECGGVLLAFTRRCAEGGAEAFGEEWPKPCMMPLYCPWWSHEQHVTPDGRCGHCGARVPVAVLSERELERERAKVRAAAHGYGLLPAEAPAAAAPR
jgi:pyruvate-formate lyase-activating enzyme